MNRKTLSLTSDNQKIARQFLSGATTPRRQHPLAVEGDADFNLLSRFVDDRIVNLRNAGGRNVVMDFTARSSTNYGFIDRDSDALFGINIESPNLRYIDCRDVENYNLQCPLAINGFRSVSKKSISDTKIQGAIEAGYFGGRSISSVRAYSIKKRLDIRFSKFDYNAFARTSMCVDDAINVTWGDAYNRMHDRSEALRFARLIVSLPVEDVYFCQGHDVVCIALSLLGTTNQELEYQSGTVSRSLSIASSEDTFIRSSIFKSLGDFGVRAGSSFIKERFRPNSSA